MKKTPSKTTNLQQKLCKQTRSFKKRIVQGNQVPSLIKEFQKSVYTRSRLKNKMNKNPDIKNITAYKRQ